MSTEHQSLKQIVSQSTIYRTESVTISCPIEVPDNDVQVTYIRSEYTKVVYDDGSVEYSQKPLSTKYISINFSQIPNVLEIAPGVMMSKNAAAGFIKKFGDTLTP